MSVGNRERIIGYLGERSVERFFLLNGINCRIVEFEAFDAVVITDCDTLLKCQIKTTQSKSWHLTCGKKRNSLYTNAVDFFALVKLHPDGVDQIYFYKPEELPKTSKSVNTVNEGDEGIKGWLKVKV